MVFLIVYTIAMMSF